MASQPLFDNRYRYDYIYPRGRSGETLRAVDTAQDDRPVVIKRPAPQDAPPLRAAQAVSIHAEKKALERLAGHPALAAMLGSGDFRAGGSSYEYIVLERATGEVVEEMVLGGERLPELELLHIVDTLLDLLIHAHDQHVIYNDVDAKHLFWHRDAYQLKVIDWGNAVLKDDAKRNTAVTVASDIFQMGELLYFLYQGGARLNNETSPEGEYRVLFFGEVPAPIREIITKATHPNLKSQRYGNLRALRKALAAYRDPLLAERQRVIDGVRGDLSDEASQQQLRALEARLAPVLVQDPAYPPTRELQRQIHLQLQYIQVQADFDAARIYFEAGNWERAIHLIDDLIPDADPAIVDALRFLVMAAEQFQRAEHATIPPSFNEVIDDVLSNQAHAAARLLLSLAQHEPDYRQDMLLLAERLGGLYPRLVMLRPPLARVRAELPDQAATLKALWADLDTSLPDDRLMTLIARYSDLAIRITDAQDAWEEAGRAAGYPAETFENLANRASDAAQAIIHALRTFGAALYADPARAEAALHDAHDIDPHGPHFAPIAAKREAVRQAVDHLSTFQPNPDGDTIPAWLRESAARLQPLADDLGNTALQHILGSLQASADDWEAVKDALILGRRAHTVALLEAIAGRLGDYNAAVAAWCRKTAELVTHAAHPERFAANAALGERLLEGYTAWDTGQMGRAADHAAQAKSLARTEGERFAAARLADLARLTGDWLNGGAVRDPHLTDATERAALGVLLDDERALYTRFSEQMPSEDTYLKSMRKGVVNRLHDSSSVAWRALFVHYSLRGVLDIQAGDLDAAEFWHQAALKTDENLRTHPVFTAFDGELVRRRLIIAAEETLQSVTDIRDLHAARDALNAPLADAWLKSANRALNLLDDALNKWADGEFRDVREKLREAQSLLTDAEAESGMDLTPLRTLLAGYLERAEELVERRGIVERAAMAGETDPHVLRALEQIASITRAALDEGYARQPRLWVDRYRQMLRTHQDAGLTKREKLAAFENNFAALFIDKHPAYRLFLRWQEAARALPEDVVEDVQIDVDADDGPDTTTEAPIYMDNDPDEAPDREVAYEDLPAAMFGEDDEAEIQPRRPYQTREADTRGRGWNIIIIGALVILLGLAGLAGLQLLSDDGEPLTGAATRQIAVLDPAEATGTATAQGQAPPTRIPTRTPTDPPPTRTPTPRPATVTPTPSDTPFLPTVAPSLTPSPVITLVTNTPAPSHTPSPVPSDTPAPDLAPDVRNDIDALNTLSLIQPEDYAWDPTFFSAGAGGAWQLGASVAEAGAAPIAVTFPPDFLEIFNPDTATRLRSASAEMELVLFAEERLAGGGVYFGLGLQNAGRQRYGAQVQLRGANVVSLGVNENGNFRGVSQLPLSPVRVMLSLQRNPDGSAVFFINGQRLGESPPLFPLDEPVSLVLYHAGGGMFVTVDSLSLALTPFDADE